MIPLTTITSPTPGVNEDVVSGSRSGPTPLTLKEFASVGTGHPAQD